MNVSPGSRPAWFPLPRAWRAHAVRVANSVLLETAGGLGDDHTSYLFTEPVKLLRAASAAELGGLLADVEAATRSGFYVAGRLDYEAGYLLHEIPSEWPPKPVACFGVYREPLRFDHHTVVASGPLLAEAEAKLSATPALSQPEIQVSREAYAEQFAAVQGLLAAGDTYQVNLTARVTAKLLGSPLALYESLIDAQPVDHAAIVHFDDSLTLSFSPELFFRTEGARIVTRPMKGTAPRGQTPEDDARQREWLAHDEKNHAEHVMIVDLLRNDLGRICEPGSVRADGLFRVEPYPTLFQMTSTVSGTLRAGTAFRDIVRALFPSGSVTGAPKRRTMEIIRDLEDSPRGVYTGAIGFVTPNGQTCFSVPIRTLETSGSHITLGVGGGVVADSTADAEYDESLLKASFLNRAAAAPQLIETLLWKDGYPLLELHLTRLERSAEQLGFRYDATEIREALHAASTPLGAESRVRLLLSADGSVQTEVGTIAGKRGDLHVRISARRTLSTDAWLQHKTTRRALYERELSRARVDGFDEVIFLNEHDELTEGSISNLFIEIDGRLCTPPLSCGALPGVYRQHLFDTQTNIVERVLRLEDLASAQTVYLGNALRGLRSVGSFAIE